ncbi:MAG: hypothetical protein E7180_01285 [Erysipelotrichaceae bacterium]|nr:hypothetical protein [Erysipelotrichaceae bacterium]
MKKKLLRIFFAFIMFFSVLPTAHIYNNEETKINAVNHTGGEIYFIRPANWTLSTIMMFIGHDSYTSVYKMNKVTSGENLYQYTMPAWDGANYIAFANASSTWGSGNWGPSNRTNATHYTNVYNNYGFNSGSVYLWTPGDTSSSSPNNTSISCQWTGANYSSVNRNYTINASNAAAGTLSISGRYVSSLKATGEKTATTTASNASASLALCPSTTATLTATANSGYTFNGWYDNEDFTGTALSTNSSYKVTVGSDYKSFYAKFSPVTYTISYNLNGGTLSTSNPTSYNIETATFNLINPTKTGYTFTGWTDSNDSTPQTSVSIAKGSTGNKTYTANWTPINYTISYNLDGGTVNSANPSSYNIETATFTLNNPTKTGYTFTGWTGSNGSIPQTSVSISLGSTGNKSYTANWSANEYTVSFDVNGGNSSHDSKDVAYDAEYGTLPTPTHGDSSYIFTGWFTEASGGTEITSSTIVNTADDHTLYAQWEQLTKYTLTLDPNGNKASVDPTSIQFYETLRYGYITSLPTPTRTGYDFAGWYSASSGGELVDDNTIVLQDADHTIYAHWTAINYTITFNSMGGSNVDPITEGYETPINEPDEPTRTGYTFTGWHTDEECTEAYTFTTMPLNGITLYAGWEANTYTVTLDTQGGTAKDPITVTYDSTYDKLPLPTSVGGKTGYTFAGWFTDPVSGTEVTRETTVKITADQTLYAHWTANIYPATLNVNYGDTPTTQIINVTYDSPIPTVIPPSRTGYTFLGYYTGAVNGTQVIDENGVSVSNWTNANNTTVLYAHWEIIEYTITYTMQMDGVISFNPETYTVETETFTLVNPEKYGAEFLGWTGSNGNTPSTEITITKGSTGNKSYTAQWSGTITFHINGTAYNTAKSNWSGTINKESLHVYGSSGDYQAIDWNNDYNATDSKTRFTYDSNKKEHTYVVTLSTITYGDYTKFVDINGVVFYFFQNGEMKQTTDITNITFDINDVGGHYELVMPNSFSGSGNPWKINNVSLAKMSCVTYRLPDGTIIGEDYYTPDGETLYYPIHIEIEGNKLEAWYTNTSLTSKFDAGVNILDGSELNLYAKYSPAEDYFLYIDTTQLTDWSVESVYFWNGYFRSHNNTWPGNMDAVTDLGNGIIQISVDASKSYTSLIVNDGAQNDAKQTVDITLTPQNVYYIVQNTKEGEKYNVSVETDLSNLMTAQKVNGDVNAFRFGAGLSNSIDNLSTSSKNFGYKFIFVDKDGNNGSPTSYVGYWNFSSSNMLDALRVGNILYLSEELDQSSSYQGYYALTLTDDVSFRYENYDQIVVIACYKDTSGNIQVIKAQEYNIEVDNEGVVTINTVQR